MITVIIPARNGGANLERCLKSILDQDVEEEVEIVVVDSGSMDGSDALARSFGASVDRIEPADFNHGAARNLGISHARGEIIVFISQDAYAVDRTWLRRLTAPLINDSTLAGVYGRQVAHDAANPCELYFLDFLYGPNSRRQRAESVEQLSMSTTIFSNVNAAMRLETLREFPFVEDIIMSEDQEWSCRVLLAGKAIQYEAEAVVRHSHSYTLRQAFSRFFDSGVSAERSYLAGAAPAAAVLRREVRRYAKGELRWLWHTHRRRWIPYAAVYEMAKFSGLQLGKRHRLLPVSFKRRMTALPNYWESPLTYPDPAPAAPAGAAAVREPEESASGERP